jgi:hypothetical protein
MPYAPGINFTGGESIARGIESFGQSMGQGIERRRQEAQKFKALEGLATAYDPNLKGTLSGMSLGELEGLVQGAAVKNHMAQQASQQKFQEAQIANLTADNERQGLMSRAQIDQMTAGNERAKRLQMSQEQLNELVGQRLAPQGNPDAAGPVAPMTYEELMGMGARSGMVGTPEFDRLAASHLRYGQNGGTADPGFEFLQDPVSGSRFVRSGRQLLPSGTDQTVNPSAPEPIIDPTTGEAVALGVRDRNGRLQVLKRPEGPKGLTLNDRAKIHNNIAKLHQELMMVSTNNQPAYIAQIDAMEGLLKEGATTPGAAPTAAPQANRPAQPRSTPKAGAQSDYPIGARIKQGGVTYRNAGNGWVAE